MRKHTTHFNDCGCLSEKLDKRIRELEKALGTVLHHEMSDRKSQAEFGGYVLDEDVKKMVLEALNQNRGEGKT